MTVYDSAYDLARAIRESEPMQAVIAAKGKVDADPQAKEMLNDLLTRQAALEMKRLSGEDTGGEEAELEKMYSVITLHSDVRDFLVAQSALGQMFADIQKIISLPLAEVFPDK